LFMSSALGHFSWVTLFRRLQKVVDGRMNQKASYETRNI
jgi:hypothetical protein